MTTTISTLRPIAQDALSHRSIRLIRPIRLIRFFFFSTEIGIGRTG